MNHLDSPADLVPGVIRVEGADAAGFLRAQLSNDVLRLGPDRHFLAAWCDAKGRTQLVPRVVAVHEAFLLVLPRPLIQAAMQRLRMFVLRLDVRLSDASESCPVGGLLDADEAPAVNETRRVENTLHLGLPPTIDGVTRTMVLSDVPADPGETMAITDNTWQLAAIDAGVPEITLAVQGAFVPQMLNLHWLMAIDFDKGCYPGQEVIARLHYRGRLTRRVFRLACDGQPPAIGSLLQDADANRVGTVLQAASTGEHGARLLAVVGVEPAGGVLRTESGHEARALDLPYATPD